MRRMIQLVVVCLVLALAMSVTQAQAGLITNGTFDTGTLAGWTVVNQATGSGNWYIYGPAGTTPVSGRTVQPPPGLNYGATTDQPDVAGAGSHVMYQDFTVPVGITSATLTFDRYINNIAYNFITPDTLDFTGQPNQQARVDIISTGGPLFDNTGVLQAIYGTQWNDPVVSGYTTDVTALLLAFSGQTLRLRFAEVDNLSGFNFAVDNIDITYTAGAAPVPEPATMLLFGSGLVGLAGMGRKKLRQQLT